MKRNLNVLLALALILCACSTATTIPEDGTIYGPGEKMPVITGNAVEKVTSFMGGATTEFNIKYYFVNTESEFGLVGTNEIFVYYSSLADAIDFACEDARVEKEKGNSVTIGGQTLEVYCGSD